MRKILVILLTLVLFCACDNTPRGVLSKGKMEDILFDYHLAQSMIYDLSREEQDDKAQEYIDAVFRKHGVTQEEFDSSLVWYNRNSKEYHKIYENLKDRFDKMNNELQLQNGNKDMMAVFSNGGDTTNIWGAQKLIILRNNKLLNRESFTIKADTNFHKSDTYILMCKINMILENKTARKEYVAVGLSVTYKNGKTVGMSRQVSMSEKIQLSVASSDSLDISKISGFFYFNGNPSYRCTAFINDIQLIRMHQQAKVEAVEELPDSSDIKLDNEDELTIIESKDSIVHERISPEDLLQKNKKRERTIDIKAAPEIRTPNSYGRRKKATKANAIQ